MFSLLLTGSLFTAVQLIDLTHLAAQVRPALATCETWLARQQSVVFDVRLYSVAEEALPDVQFAGGFPENRHAEHILRPNQVAAVQKLLPHIVAAGHAREEIQTTLVTNWDRRTGESRERSFVAEEADAAGGVRRVHRDRRMYVEFTPDMPLLSRTNLVVFLDLQPVAREFKGLDGMGYICRFGLKPGEAFLFLVPDPLQDVLKNSRQHKLKVTAEQEVDCGWKVCIVTPRRVAKGELPVR